MEPRIQFKLPLLTRPYLLQPICCLISGMSYGYFYTAMKNSFKSEKNYVTFFLELFQVCFVFTSQFPQRHLLQKDICHSHFQSSIFHEITGTGHTLIVPYLVDVTSDFYCFTQIPFLHILYSPNKLNENKTQCGIAIFYKIL